MVSTLFIVCPVRVTHCSKQLCSSIVSIRNFPLLGQTTRSRGSELSRGRCKASGIPLCTYGSRNVCIWLPSGNYSVFLLGSWSSPLCNCLQHPSLQTWRLRLFFFVSLLFPRLNIALYDQSCRNFDLEDGKGPQDFEQAMRTAKKEGTEWLKLAESKFREFGLGAHRDFLKCFGRYENKAPVLGMLYQSTSSSIIESSLTVRVKSAFKQCSNCVNRTLPEVESFAGSRRLRCVIGVRSWQMVRWSNFGLRSYRHPRLYRRNQYFRKEESAWTVSHDDIHQATTDYFQQGITTATTNQPQRL